MKPTINEQEKLFYLATEDGWVKIAGHEIKIGELCFCATLTGNLINPLLTFSEVSTGSRVALARLSIIEVLESESKKAYLKLLHEKAAVLNEFISKNDMDMKKRIADRRKVIFKELGEKPPTENINLDSRGNESKCNQF